jgi:hypothetical protein
MDRRAQPWVEGPFARQFQLDEEQRKRLAVREQD